MTRVPDPVVELLRKDALAPATAADVRARLAAAPDGTARLAALDDDDRAILAALPPDQVAAEVQRRSRAVVVTKRRGARAGLLAAAAACAGLFIAVGLPSSERAKGEAPTLIAHRLQGGVPQALAPGDAVAPGDLVQLSVGAAGDRYGVVVSLDGAGGASLQQPASADGDTALRAGVHPLDHAWEIDAAAGFERFVLVVDEEPLDPAAVLAAARALARDPDAARDAPLVVPGRHVVQSSLVLSKRSP